jgi:hypothetical protein
VTGYKIYQATAPGGLETPIGTASGPGIVVPHLNNGTMYYFTVSALSATGQESAQSTEASAEPQRQGHQVQIPASVPKQLVALLAAAGATVVAVAFTLLTRRGHLRWRARDRQRAAVAPDVRAVADTARPDVMSVHDTGREPVHTVRIEPDPGIATMTIREKRQ